MKTRTLAFLLALASFILNILLLALPVQTGLLRGYFGDVLVVVFLSCLVRGLFLTPVHATALGVFIFASGVEFLQLLRLDRLWGLEGSLMVRVTIGATFDPWDFAAYVAGAVLSFLLMRQPTERGKER